MAPPKVGEREYPGLSEVEAFPRSLLPHPDHLRSQDKHDTGVIHPEYEGEKELEGTVDFIDIRHLEEIEAKSLFGHFPEYAGPQGTPEGR